MKLHRTMRRPLRTLTVILLVQLPLALWSQPRLLDDFREITSWKAVASEGAQLVLSQSQGRTGPALQMAFDFAGGSGYVVAEKPFALDLPPNYQFTFDMRGETPPNNFEFKLTDDKENVFWIKKLNIQYPKDWTKQRIKKRQISFAWGPAGGGSISKVTKIEFAVSCGSGGKGTVWFDNFRFEPIEGTLPDIRPNFSASGGVGSMPPVLDAPGAELLGWRSDAKTEEQYIQFAFHRSREVGGLVIDWDSLDFAKSYEVLTSDDEHEWATSYVVGAGRGGRDYIYMHEGEGTFLRIAMHSSSRQNGYAIRRLAIKGPEFSSSPTDFFHALAADAPRGYYPKYFSDQQSYWTVLGVNGDTKKALLNEQGQLELGKGLFSLEPFLYIDGKLITWNDVTPRPSLFKDYLPFPAVTWTSNDGWTFTMDATAAGVPGNSLVAVRYSFISTRPVSNGKVFIAIRPFQVNPPWQSLNSEGGAARIDSIAYKDGYVYVNGLPLIPMTAPQAFGASAFERGGITDYMAKGTVPQEQNVHDRFGYASAALEYDFSFDAGQSGDIVIAYPFHGWTRSPVPNMKPGDPQLYYKLMFTTTAGRWQGKLNQLRLNLPPVATDVANTLRSTLAYIFINRSGAGLQPGSRNYDRSWIRDGALTCDALLRCGQREEVRAFLDWYAKGQMPDGRIPCVIDSRGPDPVPEHDSNGEFIYAVLEDFRFTRDTLWLRGKFDAVVKTVRYIQKLRAERKTDTFKSGTPEQRALYGLVTQSISHEGYSDVPRHSYWDDFFILRGLKDATTIARVLGETSLEREFAAERDDFQSDLYASMRLAMKNKDIDYIPGCAELGDFDATSTTIGVDPCGELGKIPEPALHNTFDKYFAFFTDRESTKRYVNYTPYEMRVIGTFVRLGQKNRAEEALNFFMKDRRPAAWNQWAEVVWRNADTPKYVGDIPHTWVGSDFIRSLLTMFAYERESDSALVLASGIPDAWINDTTGAVSIQGLHTVYGEVNLTLRKRGNRVSADLAAGLDPASCKVLLESPLSGRLRSVKVDGKKEAASKSGEVRITHLPATVEFTYERARGR
ncbi:MAG TPA: discoidin domain-containing protein [Bacteroidota bacterium]|nr:discoidin domain-containing protein [Bacteroidota bacterium]